MILLSQHFSVQPFSLQSFSLSSSAFQLRRLQPAAFFPADKISLHFRAVIATFAATSAYRAVY